MEEPEAEEAATTEEDSTASLDAVAIEKKLEEVPAAPEPVNGDAAAAPATQAAEAAPEAATEDVTVPDPEAAVEEIAAEDVKEPEKPKDPSPTPVTTRQAAVAPAPAQPPKPMTWASRAAAAATPRPVVPLPKTATPPAQARPAAPAQTSAAPAAATTPAAAPATPTTESAAAAAPAKESSEWQTAGSDSKRQNRPQSISGTQAEKDGTMGYVKYVTEKVKHEELKQALAEHGELVYFDINRQKVSLSSEYCSPCQQIPSKLIVVSPELRLC